MKILLMFSGQGDANSNLFQMFADDDLALNYVSQLATAASINIAEHSADDLRNPRLAQILIASYQLTLFKSIEDLISTSQLEFAGYSLGEVSAFLLSIQAEPKIAIEVLRQRTFLMVSNINIANEAYDLVSFIGTFDIKMVQQLSSVESCGIAITISNSHVVLGGTISNLDKLLKKLSDLYQCQIKYLNVQLPSHTPIYKEQSAEFSKFILSTIPNGRLRYPIISPVQLQKIYDDQHEAQLLGDELCTTLDWKSVSMLISEYKYDLILDLGPGAALSSFLKEVHVDPSLLVTVSNFQTIHGLRNKITQKMTRTI